jgi:transcription elongation GreA/GreB family factor
VGTRVTFERDGVERTVEIVGHDESEPAAGRVAFSAPLVKAMLGAEVDDEVEVAGGGMTILGIEVA